MTTERQIEANRRNAMKATGPRTAAGKARSSMNALKHGLCSQDVVMVGEDPAEFTALRRQLRRAVKPANDLEAMLVDQMVSAAWRLRRACRYERLLMTQELDKYRCFWDGNRELRERQFPDALGVAVAHFFAKGTYPNLARYEGHLNRAIFGALRELHRLRRDGSGQAGPKGWPAPAEPRADPCSPSFQRDLGLEAKVQAAYDAVCRRAKEEARRMPNEPIFAYDETNPFADRADRAGREPHDGPGPGSPGRRVGPEGKEGGPGELPGDGPVGPSAGPGDGPAGIDSPAADQ